MHLHLALSRSRVPGPHTVMSACGHGPHAVCAKEGHHCIPGWQCHRCVPIWRCPRHRHAVCRPGVDWLYSGAWRRRYWGWVWPRPFLFTKTACCWNQGPIFIYAPVWVDEFSPEGSQTKWMSLLQVRVCCTVCIVWPWFNWHPPQAHVALGIMFGYVLGGVLTTNWGPEQFR